MTHAHAFEWDPDRVVVVDRDPRYGKCERRGCWVCDCGATKIDRSEPVDALGLFLDFVASSPGALADLRALMSPPY